MKKLLLASAALALMGALSGAPVYAQQAIGQGCINSGVNGVPQSGQDCLMESAVFTYAATAVALVPASAATDVACITGSATKVIRVLSIRVSGAGTLQSIPVLITKHASVNTGGTAATGTALPVPYKTDSNDVAPSATTISWTANPTIADASPGIIDGAIVTFQPATAVGGTPFQLSFLTHIYNEPTTLRGVAQQVCVNLNGATIVAGSLTISFLWTEQPQ
jgi:hypothetical protein